MYDENSSILAEKARELEAVADKMHKAGSDVLMGKLSTYDLGVAVIKIMVDIKMVLKDLNKVLKRGKK